MSSDKETAYYIELQPGDNVQVGDQWLDQFGQWHFYTHAGDTAGVVGSGVKARRPIRATHQTTYEEVPGSRTTQDTVVQPQRDRIAYEDLQPGEIIQEGDQWQNECGRWRPFLVLNGSRVQVRQSQRVRRPYNITQLENDRAEAIAEVAKLSAELWARKPLEERVTSLTEELAQAREAAIAERNEAERLLAEAQMQRDKAWSDQKAIQACRDTALQELTQAREASEQLLQTIADNADQFAEHTATLVKQRDGFDAELQRLQEVVRNLYNEPTAKQVQDMLRTWATELDWSAGCFDSVGRDEIDTIQKTLIAVIERIEHMLSLEGGTDDN